MVVVVIIPRPPAIMAPPARAVADVVAGIDDACGLIAADKEAEVGGEVKMQAQ